MSTKIPRGSPTGQTPVQTSKRMSCLRGYSSVAKRNLSREFDPEAGAVSNVAVPQAHTSAVPHTAWSVEEVTLLLSFIAKQGKLRWQAASYLDFWKQASQYLREDGKERTGYRPLISIAIFICIIYYLQLVPAIQKFIAMYGTCMILLKKPCLQASQVSSSSSSLFQEHRVLNFNSHFQLD